MINAEPEPLHTNSRNGMDHHFPETLYLIFIYFFTLECGLYIVMEPMGICISLLKKLCSESVSAENEHVVISFF